MESLKANSLNVIQNLKDMESELIKINNDKFKINGQFDKSEKTQLFTDAVNDVLNNHDIATRHSREMNLAINKLNNINSHI